MEKINIKKQLDRFASKSLPLWEEFPDLELYMDQLVSLGNRYLNGLLETKITASMVNSYVKKGLMSRPQKKKYNAQHLAELLVISLLKSVYSLDTVKSYNAELLHEFSPKESYNGFANLFNETLKSIANSQRPPTPNTRSLNTLTKYLIINAVIYKLLGENLLDYSLTQTKKL